MATAPLPPRLLPAAWIYDRDPFQPLKWQDDLEKFKARLGAGEDVFGPLIRKYLLDNGHRVTVELRPDSSLGDKIEQTEQERLQVRARPVVFACHGRGVFAWYASCACKSAAVVAQRVPSRICQPKIFLLSLRCRPPAAAWLRPTWCLWLLPLRCAGTPSALSASRFVAVLATFSACDTTSY